MTSQRTGTRSLSLLLVLGLGLTVGLLSSPSNVHAERSFHIVVHKSNPIDSMSASRLSELFLKKVTRWESGRRVQPLDLAEGLPARESFSEEIHGRSVAAIKSFWQQQIFSGRDVPPPQKFSDSEVLAYVASNPDAIGYVSADANVADVKVLEIE